LRSSAAEWTPYAGFAAHLRERRLQTKAISNPECASGALQRLTDEKMVVDAMPASPLVCAKRCTGVRAIEALPSLQSLEFSR